LENLIEKPRSVTFLLLLDDKTACQNRKQYKAEQCDFSGI